MELCRSGVYACVLVLLNLYAGADAYAACSDKTMRTMADAGQSTSSIAKRCGVSASTVKNKLGDQNNPPARTPSELAPAAATPSPPAATPPARVTPRASSASGSASSKPLPAPEPAKQPPGTILEMCGCYGSQSYGFTEPNAQCSSGKAVATRCPGYCPVNRSPWRRICS